MRRSGGAATTTRAAFALSRNDLLHGAVVVAWTVSYYLFRNALDAALLGEAGRLAPWVQGAAAAALAAGFARVRHDAFPALFATMTRLTAAGVLVYLVVEPPDFTLANPDAAAAARFVSLGYWPALLASAVALWRPAFLFLPAWYVLATRSLAPEISGFQSSVLDIRYMMEMAEYLALSACALAVLRRIGTRGGGAARIDLGLLAVCCAFVTIGFHLGNYFWSGVAKLMLGPMPWTWIIENQTHNVVPVALMRGVLPFGAWPGITAALHDGLGAGLWLSNAFVLGAQLFAIVAVLRLAWLKLASLAYDALHVGIFVMGGLFFWPWVWNNLTILFAVSRAREDEVALLPRLCCIAAILFGLNPALGGSARLAWWDVLDIKIPMVQARTGPDAPWVDVPVSYFLSHSYIVSHGYLDRVATPGHYPPSIWGGIWDHARHRASGRCAAPTPPPVPESPEQRAARLARVEAFLRAHHAKMVARAELWPAHAYYLRSHHHPSNPLLHRDFTALAPAEITEYRLLVKSTCLRLVDGHVVERVLHEEEHRVDVRDGLPGL